MLNFQVDKIRLELPVYDEDFEYFANTVFSQNPYVKLYSKNDSRYYRYNYTIHETYTPDNPFNSSSGENRFSLHYWHNSERFRKPRHNLVIEYNPNKCNIGEGLLNKILKRYFLSLRDVKLKACDVCCDFDGIHIDTVVYDKNRKSEIKDYCSANGRTIYLGSSGGNGQVKVYDKAAEQKKTGTMTRWETTLRFGDWTALAFLLNAFDSDTLNSFANLPIVHFGDNGFTTADNVELMSFVHSIKTGYLKLNDFSRRRREIIKRHLYSSALYSIDNSNMPDIIGAIISYFEFYVEFFEIERYKNKNKIIQDVLSYYSDYEQLRLA